MYTPAEHAPFAPHFGEIVRSPKLSHLIAARLRAEIVNGKLKPGSLLLPESGMLELFNVSRPTLREALRVLEAESLISVGRGFRTGAVVLGPSIRKAADYATTMLVHDGVTMRDVHEARMFFEPAIVGGLKGASLAKAVPPLLAHVAEMQQAFAELRFLDVLACTNRFHEELVCASGNRTLAVLLGMFQTISDDAYAVNLSSDGQGKREVLQRNMEKSVAGYATLCDLLEKGKTAEAASFWRLYMERALDFLVRSKIGERRLVVAPLAA